MILKIKCPCCNSDLSINIENDEITSVELNGTINVSQDEIKNILNDMGIEFGILEGGEIN